METPDPTRTARTYRCECWRAVSTGILETGATVFLLLIAVRHYQAGATAKALIAAGGSIGLLLTPLVVWVVQHLGWPAARAAARVANIGTASCLAMVALPFLPVFVVGSVLAMAAAAAAIPLLTQIYQENYPEAQRGRLFSRAVMIRIGVAALFSELAGEALSQRPDSFRWLLLLFAAAFGFSAYWLGQCPSRPLPSTGSINPFRSLRFVREDRLFRRTLLCWMLMGFANLMMLPLRIEYLANPVHGLALSAAEIAFLTGVVPNLARLLLSPLWGRLFDRMNFFVLRVTVNVGFAVGILAFFTSNSVVGLIVGSIVHGIANAGGDVAWGLWVTKFAPPSRVADYMAIHTFLTGVRGVFAPLVAFHLVSSFSVVTLGWFSGGLILLASLILLPEIPRGRGRTRTGALVEEIAE